LIGKSCKSEITANVFLVPSKDYLYKYWKYVGCIRIQLFVVSFLTLFIVSGLNEFGIGLLSVGSLLSILTLYLVVDACHNILSQKESAFYKANAITILSVYPVASVCSLTAIAIPRWKVNKNFKNIPLLSQLTIMRYICMTLKKYHRKTLIKSRIVRNSRVSFPDKIHDALVRLSIQRPATLRGSDSDFSDNLALSALSFAAARRSTKDQGDTDADATSRALLLLALSALSEPSDDRCQFIVAGHPGPAASYRPGKKHLSLLSFSPSFWLLFPTK